MLVDSSNSTAGSAVTGAIRQAAQATGTSFQYLLATAQVESGLNPQAGASTSSARGLFQFVEQTWLGTMKQSGAALGYGHYADAITKTASGRYEVSDPAMRSEILKLRNDPTANAVMAGAFTQANAALLSAEARPLAQRRRTLHRALSRRRRRGAADLARRRQSACQRRELFSDRRARQFARSSTTARPARRAASRRCATFSPRATTWRRARPSAPAVRPRKPRAAPAERHGRGGRQRLPIRFPRRSQPCRSHHSDLSGRRRRSLAIRSTMAAATTAALAAAVPDTAGMTSAFADAVPQRRAAGQRHFPRPVSGSRPHRPGRRGREPALGRVEHACRPRWDVGAVCRRRCSICSRTSAGLAPLCRENRGDLW